MIRESHMCEKVPLKPRFSNLIANALVIRALNNTGRSSRRIMKSGSWKKVESSFRRAAVALTRIRCAAGKKGRFATVDSGYSHPKPGLYELQRPRQWAMSPQPVTLEHPHVTQAIRMETGRSLIAAWRAHADHGCAECDAGFVFGWREVHGSGPRVCPRDRTGGAGRRPDRYRGGINQAWLRPHQ